MTFKTKAMLWLGAAFTAALAGILFTELGGNDAWAPAVVASAGFAFFGIAFFDGRWALIAIPSFVLTVTGLHFFWQHPNDPTAIAVLVVTIVANIAGVYWRTKRSKPHHA